ncbi:hypothetical protein JW848_11490 [Candidatus Bipolaricaulota bacterium]|nr:hypothetical protein [Candidatus Bipolaricaulota bacterium]
MDQALHQRERALGSEVSEIERMVRFADELNPAELRSELQSQALFVQARHFIVRHADAVKRPKDLVQALRVQCAPATYITILAGSLPMTSGWIKGLKGIGEIAACPAPSRGEIVSWVRQMFADYGLCGAPALIRLIVETSGGDLLALEQEAMKLHAYVHGIDDSTRTFDRSVVESLVFPCGETTIWPVLDLIGERNVVQALAMLQGLREEPVSVMSMIMRHLTRLSMIRALLDDGMNAGDVGKLLGIPGWLIKKLSAQASRWSGQELIAALGRAIRLDLEVKSGDRRPYDALLKLVIPEPQLLPTP